MQQNKCLFFSRGHQTSRQPSACVKMLAKVNPVYATYLVEFNGFEGEQCHCCKELSRNPKQAPDVREIIENELINFMQLLDKQQSVNVILLGASPKDIEVLIVLDKMIKAGFKNIKLQLVDHELAKVQISCRHGKQFKKLADQLAKNGIGISINEHSYLPEKVTPEAISHSYGQNFALAKVEFSLASCLSAITAIDSDYAFVLAEDVGLESHLNMVLQSLTHTLSDLPLLQGKNVTVISHNLGEENFSAPQYYVATISSEGAIKESYYDISVRRARHNACVVA